MHYQSFYGRLRAAVNVTKLQQLPQKDSTDVESRRRSLRRGLGLAPANPQTQHAHSTIRIPECSSPVTGCSTFRNTFSPSAAITVSPKYIPYALFSIVFRSMTKLT